MGFAGKTTNISKGLIEPKLFFLFTYSIGKMYMSRIEDDIQQEIFNDNFSKAIVNLVYTSNHLVQLMQSLFKPHELTQPQFNILRILRGQYPKAATINLLIERMLDKSSNASRIVDRLEAKGLVTRKQCNDDRRAVDVLITAKGLKMLSTIDDEMIIWEESINKLSETEISQLNHLLDKIRG